MRLQLGADVGEVVDLAVEDDLDRPVLVAERLIAGREVDDAQPAVAEADPRVDEIAGGVRAAMRERDARRFAICSGSSSSGEDSGGAACFGVSAIGPIKPSTRRGSAAER